MPGSPVRPIRTVHTARAILALVVLILSAVLSDAVRAVSLTGDAAAASVGHLVISEVLTGGSSASDEFAELYNPSDVALSLDGVELIYVTASGATITRKASWAPGAVIDPGEHALVANEAGIFAGVADAIYAGGLAATGGSLALRSIGGSTAIDAVGWGTAASVWLETAPAPAPPAGTSLERLPGGDLGSGQDTDHNLVDFVARPAPDPQNSGSPPVPSPTSTPSPTDPASPGPTETPGPTDTPAPTATPAPTPTITPSPSPTTTQTPTPSPTATSAPTPAPLKVAEARAMPDGASIVVAGVAISSSDFTEGGGYLTDATGGIAVLLDSASFARGDALVISGTVDDRYSQRTVRADATGLTVVGPGVAPDPAPIGTGSVGEPVEGQLVTLTGIVQGSPTILTSGEAFEIDDGSGPIRILVGPGTGIDTSSWQPGTSLSVTAVVGQRDSTGTGTEGYRVQPRDPNDIGVVLSPTPTPTPAPSATPMPSASGVPSPSASPLPSQPPLVTIADARAAEVGTQLRIRGVVTLPTALLDPDTAVVADPSGAILVRTGSEVGRLVRGQLVELIGTRSTKSGMASLRVTSPALALGTQAEPAPIRHATGAIGEGDEAMLIIVRGIVGDGPRRTTGGGLSFTLDDGSGEARVFAPPASGITAPRIPAGSWVEVRAVVGQETTGAEPNAGYRLWPRDRDDVTLIAAPVAPSGKLTPTASRVQLRLQVGTSAGAVAVAPLIQPVLRLDPMSTPTVEPSADAQPESESPASRAPIPLAGGAGSVAGLLALAFRHGTLQRLADAIRRRMEAARNPVPSAGNEEGDAYTPAP